MKTTGFQDRPATWTAIGPDADRSGSSRLSRGFSDMAIVGVVALIVFFQVADRVLGRNKASGRLKVV